MTATNLTIRVVNRRGESRQTVQVTDLVIAGWTGRNRDAMEHHIAELEALGVKRPPRTPMYYRVATSRLTCAPEIQVLGGDSSGEAEFILISTAGGLYIGVGSDHTDRRVEAVGVSLSKQMCDKPLGEAVWPYVELKDHWDELVLRSYAEIGGERILYQEGSMSAMLAPDSLMKDYDRGSLLAPGTVMFGGTLPAKGGIRPAERFACEIEDPVLRRRLTCSYRIRTLPDLG